MEQQSKGRRQEQHALAGGGRLKQQRVEAHPNDFRLMSIFPDVEADIHSTDKPFLRKNVVKGELIADDFWLTVKVEVKVRYHVVCLSLTHVLWLNGTSQWGSAMVALDRGDDGCQ